ncbi:TniQ family protein [Paracoccus sp. (in: a-proteobacteria)]|uniref:TniQ family protein n=1 Tax=Paracoccus sp. TaxID=267 RepID=UPI0028AABC4A|nr:TniQ family protein [Paracoccus sp. (in: a-proteobacteria)]
MAAFHINGPITTFLRDLALNPMLLSRDDPDEVPRLCKIAGQNPEPVLRNTLVQHIRRAHRLGRDTLIASLCRPQDLRFCPACLAEDDAPAAAAGQDGAIHRRERLIWRLKRVRCCAVHALPLICRDRPDGADGRGVFAESVPETTAMLEHMVRSTAPCPGSPLQDYIADRVAGRSGPAWLDDPPLEQVIRITERLGAFPEFGPHTLFEDLTVREQDTASACGWRYVSKGADGIFHAFRILQAGSDPMQSVGRKGLRDKWDGFELQWNEIRHPGGNRPLRRLFEEYIGSAAEP